MREQRLKITTFGGFRYGDVVTRQIGASVGYARVSTTDQGPALQVDALKSVGCEKMLVEQAAGATAERPELERAKDFLRRGDTLVVWRLDRLGRSLKDLVAIVNWLEERGAMFKSVTESIDTSTPGGKLVFHVFASLAEFERDLIKERTHAGLTAARSRGRKGGRPPAMSKKQALVARTMLKETDTEGHPKHSVSDVAAVMHVSRSTVYRALARTGDPAVEITGESRES